MVTPCSTEVYLVAQFLMKVDGTPREASQLTHYAVDLFALAAFVQASRSGK